MIARLQILRHCHQQTEIFRPDGGKCGARIQRNMGPEITNDTCRGGLESGDKPNNTMGITIPTPLHLRGGYGSKSEGYAQEIKNLGNHGSMQRGKHRGEHSSTFTLSCDSPIVCVAKITQEEAELHAWHPDRSGTDVQPVGQLWYYTTTCMEQGGWG